MESKNNDYLKKLRHSTEHVLTQAMLKLYPGIKMAMGPAIEDGFYFDFDYKGKINEENFPKIEKEMQNIIDKDLPFKKQVMSVKEARKLFPNNPYKQEWLDEIEERNEKPIIYHTGNQFSDLCSGPHLESTGKIKAFKLLSVAGAYWRGDKKNKMLTRIYGTAFTNKEKLKIYLEHLKEAKKRDHRILGRQLELYAIYPEIGAGLPVWLPNGYRTRRILEDYMIKLERSYGYEHILSPHIAKDVLFRTSGHLDFYKDSMYAPMTIDGETYFLKPMNCPMGMLVYKQKPRSYRDLPIKLGEFGTVYRYEKSGELSGLSRVRGFTQNDAHIFCTPGQLLEQFLEVFEMLQKFYKDVGFKNYKFRLGLGDPGKEKFKYCGSKRDWKHTENTIRKALDKIGIEYYEEMGEAAFYGPKIDVQAMDALGREESISTIQIDFNLAEKFKLTYKKANGQKGQPFVIHRALIGSFERFFAFLIEFYAGNFPVWLSPTQVQVVPISEKQNDYAKQIERKLNEKEISVKIDSENRPMQAKIREAQLKKIPYMIIVGDKETKDKKVSVRLRTGKDLGVMSPEQFIKKLEKVISTKSVELW